jgi:hypothetical protein
LRAALTLVAATTLVSAASVGIARASTIYDDDYQTTNTLTVQGAQVSCAAQDFTNNWETLITDPTNWEPFAAGSSTQSALAASFATAKTSGAYAVSEYELDLTSGQYGKYLSIVWAEASGSTITFDGGGVVLTAASPYDLHRLTIMSHKQYFGSGTCNAKVVNSDTPHASEISYDNTHLPSNNDYYRNFIVGGNPTINYPTGYSGINIKKTVTDNKTYPQFTMFATGTSFTSYYNKNLPDFDTRKAADKLTWTMEVKNDAGGYHQETQQQLGLEETFHFALVIGQRYRISLSYNVVAPNTPFTGITLGTRTVEFNANEGAFVADSGNIAGCDSNGLCSVTATTDVACDLTDIACHITKLVNKVNQLLTYLFIPNSYDITYAVTNNIDFIKTKLGVLAFPIEFLSGLFYGILHTTATWCSPTSCTKDFGTFYGSHFNLNFLVVHDINASLWNFLLATLRGTTVVTLIYMLKRKMQRIIHR